jgi:outer membrane receptor protein involved in Fe transport
LEATVEFRATNHVNLSAEYLLTDSTVLRFPTNAALEGLLVPQVPCHQFNFQLSFLQKGWTAALQGRFVGVQYDDDQNLLPLARFFTLDAEASRRLSKSVDLFVAVQNATNTRYQVARTPVVNLGPPGLARVGLRVHICD